jgi:valyl-tRNA synthetase
MIAKKEAKRLEKEAKLAAKALKTTTVTSTGEKKAKVEKEKKEDEAPFVDNTPKGEKKGA